MTAIRVSLATTQALSDDMASRQQDALLSALESAAPEWAFSRGSEAARGESDAWLAQCRRWQLAAIDNMVELFLLHRRWGGFEDSSAAWILSILEGELDEDDKIASLEQQLYGA